MDFVLKVGRCQMDAPIESVRARADRGGIGRPHARSGVAGPEERRKGRGDLLENLPLGAGEPEAAGQLELGPGMRRKERLGHAELPDPAHLGQSLQSSRLGMGDLTFVTSGGDVPEGHPGIVVRRADQPVEIELSGHERGRITVFG